MMRGKTYLLGDIKYLPMGRPEFIFFNGLYGLRHRRAAIEFTLSMEHGQCVLEMDWHDHHPGHPREIYARKFG